MPQQSAGLLIYRRTKKGALEVFLVHPGGPFWATKDEGAWSIPKGEFDSTEEPLHAARREFLEETGFPVEDRTFLELGSLKQPGGKVVHAWAAEGEYDASAIRSQTFQVEWPPKSGRTREFAEVDRAGWFGLEEAKGKLLQGQRPFVDRLVATLSAAE